jgi:hypothetical protein
MTKMDEKILKHGRDAYEAAKVTEPTDLLNVCQNETFGGKHKQMEGRTGKQGHSRKVALATLPEERNPE